MNKILLSSNKIPISSFDKKSLNEISKNDFVDQICVYPDIYQKEHKEWPSGILVNTKGKIMPPLTGSRLGCGMVGIKLGKLDLDEDSLLDLSNRFVNILPVTKRQNKKNYSFSEFKSNLNFIEKDNFSFKLNPLLIDSVINNYSFDAISDSTMIDANRQLGVPGLVGNHFIELQQIESIYEPRFSEVFGLNKGDYFLLIHMDSKDLNLKLESSFRKNKFLVLNENSKLASRFHNISMFMEKYCSLNRLVVADKIVKAIEEIIPVKAELLYDSTHESLNKSELNGKTIWRHHAGVAFANAKGSKKIFKKFRSIGQPIFLPGGMGAENYILASQNTKPIFESINHGAGRKVPKSEAREKFKNMNISDTFVKKNAILRQLTGRELISQISLSYKPIDLIDDLVVAEGYAKNVAKTRANIIIKG